ERDHHQQQMRFQGTRQEVDPITKPEARKTEKRVGTDASSVQPSEVRQEESRHRHQPRTLNPKICRTPIASRRTNSTSLCFSIRVSLSNFLYRFLVQGIASQAAEKSRSAFDFGWRNALALR